MAKAIDLTGQVDGLGHIEGDHAVVTRNNIGVVDIVRGVKLDGRIVVQKLVQLLAAQCGRSHQLAVIETLPTVVDHPHGIKVHDVVGHILGVEPQVILLGKGLHRGLGGGV